ncbi:MAG: cation:proton antiporter [Planctomycetota bacterium]
MHQVELLKDIVIVLGASVVVVAALRRIGIPSIAGFILTGVIAGPTSLGLVDDPQIVELLAESGVVLLLFGIGLELSIERLQRLWKSILIGGGVQVALTLGAAAGIAYSIGLATGPAIFVGCLIAVSSTAVVLRGLSRRGELDAPHGRLAVGILVFQDFCVIPMILAVPFLAGEGGSTQDVLWTMGKATVILVGVLIAARVLVPRILAFISKTRERDLFILTVFLVCFGTAWVVSLAGISLALGAFLAGLVVAGSEFRHQALTDLIPAREVLASLFFVSVGMLLDVSDIMDNIVPSISLLAAILAGKFLIVMGTAKLLRLPLRVAILSAAALCQVGEFSFVLLDAAADSSILAHAETHNLRVAIILSMLVTPMAIALGPYLVTTATHLPWVRRMLGASPNVPVADATAEDHAVVAGYGPAGVAVCRALQGTGLYCMAVDMNLDNVRTAHTNGVPMLFGDITQPTVVAELGCAKARLIVLAINDPKATELAMRAIRDLAPDVPVIARAPYELDRDLLAAAGATQIVTAEASAKDALVAASLATVAEPRDTTA